MYGLPPAARKDEGTNKTGAPLAFPCGEGVERSETDGGCEADRQVSFPHPSRLRRATFSQEKASVVQTNKKENRLAFLQVGSCW